jgi:hypothetical protein
MTELLIKNRVKFPVGKQRRFIQELGELMTIKEMAHICSCSQRTIRDWQREKFLMDYQSLQSLCQASKIPLPLDIKLLGQYWYTHLGGVAGAKAILKKYGRIGGDPENRKTKWREWWEKTGKFEYHPIINKPLPIKKPKESKELAEFVGIAMGDGGISRYQVTITLNRRDDREFAFYVKNLIKKLFGIEPAMYDVVKNSVVNIVVSRGKLVRFCTEELGLPLGNKIKQKFDIPSWIKTNEQFRIACVRGLVDTDGSVFTHEYKVGKKWYAYKKLSFSSRSDPLLNSVYEIMQSIGLHPRLVEHTEVRLDSINDMRRYFEVIGTSNPKHWKRYQN